MSVLPTRRPEGSDGDDGLPAEWDEPTVRDPFHVLAGIGVGCAAVVVAGLVAFVPFDGLPSAFRTAGPAAEDTAAAAPPAQPRPITAPGQAPAGPGRDAPGGSAGGNALPEPVLLSEAAGTRLLPLGRPQRLLDALEGGSSQVVVPGSAGSASTGREAASTPGAQPTGSASDGSSPVAGEAPEPPVDEPVVVPPAPESPAAGPPAVTPAPGSPVVEPPEPESPVIEPPEPGSPVVEPPEPESPVVEPPVVEEPVIEPPLDTGDGTTTP